MRTRLHFKTTKLKNVLKLVLGATYDFWVLKDLKSRTKSLKLATLIATFITTSS